MMAVGRIVQINVQEQSLVSLNSTIVWLHYLFERVDVIGSKTDPFHWNEP
jgi:hypothetical protein